MRLLFLLLLLVLLLSANTFSFYLFQYKQRSPNLFRAEEGAGRVNEPLKQKITRRTIADDVTAGSTSLLRQHNKTLAMATLATRQHCPALNLRYLLLSTFREGRRVRRCVKTRRSEREIPFSWPF